ncbi:hypothetical protein [Marinobacterium stanieri]|uniref:Uncharacterized protein n=1 Tax=Marinobacterium stanieri TaxID=49186 RepID=A0A1N6W689_9GAMM|nr:hypothetical protein [Marinobacterium stanieri]SIQ85637.1 hypothetical protein SAMN05421647_1107 [Marinobacterium stanieri]
MSRIYHEEDSAPLWLHIMGGILGAVVVVLISWKLYVDYQDYRAEQAIRQMKHEAQLRRERAAIQRQQSRERQTRMTIEERKRQERADQFNSPECQFWRNHYQNNMSEKNLEKVKEYCPKNTDGTLTIR